MTIIRGAETERPIKKTKTESERQLQKDQDRQIETEGPRQEDLYKDTCTESDIEIDTQR